MNRDKADIALELTANLIHQAINPLNGVIGSLDNINEGLLTPDRQEQRLRSIRAQLECIVSLIRNLGFFVEYMFGKEVGIDGKTSKTCVAPQVIIEAALFYQEAAAKRNIHIDLIDRHEQNAINGNPDLLRQVFMNVFDNAVKYSEQDTTVQVKDWIQKSTGDLIVTVESTGIGFDDEEQIFERGVRGKSAKQITASGTGIGLHVCKLIVEKVFQGTITAQHISQSRRTIIEVRLPGAFKQRRDRHERV